MLADTYIVFLIPVVSHDGDDDVMDEEGEGCHA
jgi:hypothetical protein